MFRCSPACLKALLAFFTICLVLGTSLMVIWQTKREYDLSIETDNKQLLGNARALAEHAEQSMTVAARALESVCADIGNLDAYKKLPTLVWHKLLQHRAKDLRQIGSILIVDKHGQSVVSSASFPVRNMNIADREYFLHHRDNPDNRLFVGKTVQSRLLGGSAVFTLSKRINNPDGSFGGLAAISFLVSYFDQFYGSITYHPQMQIMLINTDGWPLAVTPKTEFDTEVNIAYKQLFTKQLKIAPYGVFRNERALLDNKDRQVAFARLEAPFDNLVAVVSMPREVILAEWQRQMKASVSGALILGVFSIILSVLLLQRLNYLEQKDRELSSLNERLTLATDAGGIAVWDWDITSDKMHWDTRMYQLHGIKPDTKPMDKKRWRTTLHPDDLEQVKNTLRDALQNTDHLELGYRVIRATDGETRHLIAIARIHNEDASQHRRLIGICYDITEQKKAELFLKLAKDEAEQAALLKSSFVASVSHELRTPLNAIVGMTHLLTNSQLTPQQREQAETVNSASRTLLAIINDLLDISRIEAGKIELEHIPFSLSDQIHTQLDFIKDRAKEKGLGLHHHIDPAIPDKLVGDPLRFGQILMNLLSNALKFTEHGQISVKVSLVEKKGKSLLLFFQVKDSGIGIPPKRQQEIFSPFVQSDSTVTRRYGGTGLGLAIASQLVKMMHGEIGVESEPGKGSRFFFTLSVQQPVADNQIGNEMQTKAAAYMPEDDYPAQLPSQAATNISPDYQNLKPLIEKLEQQLKNQNMGAMVTFHQLRKQLAGYNGDELNEMELFLNELEFAKAVTILYRVAEKFGIS